MDITIEQENICIAIQNVMAESMMLGIKVFKDGVPVGSIYDEENKDVLSQFEKLGSESKKLASLLNISGLSEIDLFPLINEVEHLTSSKGI